MELRIAGVLLMLAGWILMLAAVLLLPGLGWQTTFSIAGLGVEALGFILFARTFRPRRKKHDV